MRSTGVELLKYQFSKAIDQTFERFLDSWTVPVENEAAIGPFTEHQEPPRELSVISSI